MTASRDAQPDAEATSTSQWRAADALPAKYTSLRIDTLQDREEDDDVGWQVRSRVTERSALLRNAQQHENENEAETKVPTVYEESCAIWSMGWKVSITTFCRISLATISTAFIGHLGRAELAASALASVWTNGVQMLIFGFAISICSLCSQAYGARNFALVGLWLQLGLLFLTLFSLPVMLSFCYVDRLLRVVTDDEHVLELAGLYARYLVPSVLPQAVYCALRQYLQAQELVTPATIVSVASVGVSLATNYVFIYGCGPLPALHFIGAPIAQSVSSVFQPVALLAYAFWYKGHHKKTWFGWDLAACLQYERLRAFVPLSAGMTLYLGMDEWVYNVLSALAGSLGAVNLAANSVFFSLWGLIFGIYWGFGLPMQVRSANFLGANRPRAAQRTLRVGFVLGGLTSFLAALGTYVFRDEITSFFTPDATVAHAIDAVMPVFCLAVFLSGLHMIMAAVVEAMSLASLLVAITAVGSWVVMLPASYLLGLQLHQGLHGLWWGSVVGETVKFLALAVVLLRLDWREMARQAVLRADGDVLSERELEDDVRLRSELLLPSTPTMAGTTPVLAIFSTPKQVHHHSMVEPHEPSKPSAPGRCRTLQDDMQYDMQDDPPCKASYGSASLEVHRPQ